MHKSLPQWSGYHLKSFVPTPNGSAFLQFNFFGRMGYGPKALTIESIALAAGYDYFVVSICKQCRKMYINSITIIYGYILFYIFSRWLLFDCSLANFDLGYKKLF